MEDPQAVVVFVAGGLLVVVVVILMARYYERKRSQAFQAAAAALDLAYADRPSDSLLASCAGLPLFSHGHGKRAGHVLSTATQEFELKLFDYRYTTGGGKNSHTHRQTVVFITSELLRLPAFSLKPENVLHKIGKAFGYQDLNFESHPGFSEKYLLRSADEPGCRDTFTDKILEFYEQRPGLSTEGQGTRLLFFRDSKKVRPENLAAFLKEAFQVFTLFATEAKSS